MCNNNNNHNYNNNNNKPIIIWLKLVYCIIISYTICRPQLVVCQSTDTTGADADPDVDATTIYVDDTTDTILTITTDTVQVITDGDHYRQKVRDINDEEDKEVTPPSPSPVMVKPNNNTGITNYASIGVNDIDGNNKYIDLKDTEMQIKQINSTYSMYSPKLIHDLNEYDIIKSHQLIDNNQTDDNHKYNASGKSLLPGDKGRDTGLLAKVIDIFNKRCYKNVGCFYSLSFTDNDRGHIEMMPMSPGEIDVRFLVFTKQMPKHGVVYPYKFNIKRFRDSTFNPRHRTIIIVHGYDSTIENWMLDIRNMIYGLPNNDYNVILVDWHKGAMQMIYYLSASSTQVVGALIAYFINRICTDTYGRHLITNADFYLIGHSLGAHAVGFAGKRLVNPQVSRITGLDPAGPGFMLNNLQYRLSSTDASYVEAIHTDMASDVLHGLGLNQVVGNIDFYPNGGYLQPGCPQTSMIVTLFKAMGKLSCSHSRSYQLAYGLGNPDAICQPVGYLCQSYDYFLEGRCSSCQSLTNMTTCQVMGIYPGVNKNLLNNINYNNNNNNLTTKLGGGGTGWKFYFNTAALPDYCLYHYQIAIHIASNTTQLASNGSTSTNNSNNNTMTPWGQFQLTLDGQYGQQERSNLTLYRTLSHIVPGKIHTLLVTFRQLVQEISSGSFAWYSFEDQPNQSQQQQSTGIPVQFTIKLIEINYMSHPYKNIRQDLSTILCPVNNNNKNKNNSQMVKPDGPTIYFRTCKPSKHQLAKRSTDIPYDKLVTITKIIDMTTIDYENNVYLKTKLETLSKYV
ncbi:pancreatic lipase-related protein 3-like [Oppia nitens]|uniref:pancreatic lipase-related protein 3-like n=1 Tax=Oppia nitens TaxID=1686743 RepID=UPI0023DA2CD1|nr:pancreatic lipase-related protein 3-like [Oppia nitens]